MKDDRAAIYPTMWKKTMIYGCPRDFAVALIVACAPLPMLARFIVRPPWTLAFAAVLFAAGWLFGMVMAKIDPEFFSVWLVKVRRIGPTKGGNKGNVYIP